MSVNDYQKLALRTLSESGVLDPAHPLAIKYGFDKLTPEGRAMMKLLHGALGLATESGELIDQLKKHLFYGKPLDVVNLKEEGGDAVWYVPVICDFLGISMQDMLKVNIEKLRIRYPERFTEDKALIRDLFAERASLE